MSLIVLLDLYKNNIACNQSIYYNKISNIALKLFNNYQ